MLNKIFLFLVTGIFCALAFLIASVFCVLAIKTISLLF